MEWRILNINLEIATTDINARVKYLREEDKFEGWVWVTLYDVESLPVNTLRELLVKKTEYINVLLEDYFSLYKAEDLKVEYELGSTPSMPIAEYVNGNFKFLDNYYDYMRKIKR